MHPYFYRDGRDFLVELCDSIQVFLESKDKFLVINMPPRHGKSYTAKNTTEWMFGRNPQLKVMTASYNERLSTNFAKQVRDTIDTEKVGNQLVYRDIFPNTKIKKGDAMSSMWALDGNNEKNYLATSPSGTCTGFGANVILIDDILKNAEESYNEATLEKCWDWFNNTLLQRLEGDDWKVILIMTRWAKYDLAGKILDNFDNVKLIKYKALQDDGTMLCKRILDKENYDIKTKEMNLDIVQANYQQEPIDVGGRLYGEFKEWDSLPKYRKVYNQTDTADTGRDYLCSINYIVYDKEAYILDVLYTDKPMEITEVETAKMLSNSEVNEAIIESNNGGRGFARNVERILREKYDTNKTIIKAIPQTKNKESRILISSGWVNNHIYMPKGWKFRYPEFYRAIFNYQKKAKNAHDDAPDVLASIFEKITGKFEPKILSKGDLGFY